MSSNSKSVEEGVISIHWFRKGLRLHDNPSLVEAAKNAAKVYPVFCLDPYFAKPDTVGINRYNFLLESLSDLDSSLRKLGSRLFILQGKPEEKLIQAIQEWNVTKITFEADTEPYANSRDARIRELLKPRSIEVSTFPSHTLNDMERYVALAKGAKVSTYQGFQKLFDSLGKTKVRQAIPSPDRLPPISSEEAADSRYDIPTLAALDYNDRHEVTTPFRGGETEALHRLTRYVIERRKWVLEFEKPLTSPNSLEPSTTVLSPYLKFGCLSVTKFFNELDSIYSSMGGSKQVGSQPPVSLHGQLLWREFFYFQGYITPNFDKMVGNPVIRQIPWNRDREMIEAWKEGRTGFPFIDAIMTQLRVEGWIHHLARHMVACFLTRGDLWQHWEEGVKVFDLYLLDDDWALNNANWQWLSCSNFFYQYFRCYSPIAFGKKTDPSGAYIRKWLPQLKGFPDKYIYEPWKAPAVVQQQAKCIIGKDYPLPMVDHEAVSKDNMNRMKLAYASQPKDGIANDLSDIINDAPQADSSSKSTTSTKKRKANATEDIKTSASASGRSARSKKLKQSTLFDSLSSKST